MDMGKVRDWYDPLAVVDSRNEDAAWQEIMV